MCFAHRIMWKGIYSLFRPSSERDVSVPIALNENELRLATPLSGSAYDIDHNPLLTVCA